MQDIDESLNNIILKYALDLYYPNFRKRFQAEKIMKDFFREQTGKIAFVASFASDFYHIRHFVTEKMAADYFLCEKTNRYENYASVFHTDKLAGVDWQQYDRVIVVSLDGASFLKHWLREHGIRYIFLYDLFERNGVVFDKEWDSILPDPAMEWWTYYDGDPPKQNYIVMELLEQLYEYQAAKEAADQRLHLHKAYFLALYIRDFILAAKCAARLKEIGAPQAGSWKEIEALLAKIRERLQFSEKKDIMVLWTDAMPYEDIARIPFLKNKMTEGICFDNIFTVCPFTNPTFKALLCGKMPVDDDTYSIKAITEENSPVYQVLKAHGYDIRIVGDWLTVRPEESSSLCHIPYEPATLGLWDLWRNLIGSAKPVFCIVHNLQESHSPFLSPAVSDGDMDKAHLRFERSCGWLSEQYAWYLPSLSKKTLKFYLTDHGKGLYKNRFHTYLVIEGEGIAPRRITDLCSFVDFHRLLAQLLQHHTVNEKELRRQYVEVQDLDTYNAGSAARLIAGKEAIDPSFFGYHGLVTDEYIYLHFTDGREWFVRRGSRAPEPNLFGSYICDAEAIAPFREIIRQKEVKAPSFEQKLKYSRYVHTIFDRAQTHNFQKKALLDDWLRPYPPGSVLIRTGGDYALRLYGLLSAEVRKTIGGFVDIDRNCMGAGLGFPVYTELKEVPTDTRAILLAGRETIMAQLRAEAAAAKGNFDVLDPYEFLAAHGIVCRHGAGDFEPAEEDYDVGFPFAEVAY